MLCWLDHVRATGLPIASFRSPSRLYQQQQMDLYPGARERGQLGIPPHFPLLQEVCFWKPFQFVAPLFCKRLGPTRKHTMSSKLVEPFFHDRETLETRKHFVDHFATERQVTMSTSNHTFARHVPYARRTMEHVWQIVVVQMLMCRRCSLHK